MIDGQWSKKSYKTNHTETLTQSQQVIIDIILQFRATSEIHFDRGLRFANKLGKDLLKALNINLTNSIAYTISRTKPNREI